MRNSKSQVMSCGACAVVMNEDGEMTTSIDALVNGIKRAFSRAHRSKSAHEPMVIVRI